MNAASDRWTLTKKIHICTPRQGEQLAGGAELGGGEQAAGGQEARHRDPGGQAPQTRKQDPALQGKQRHVNCDMYVISSVIEKVSKVYKKLPLKAYKENSRKRRFRAAKKAASGGLRTRQESCS